MSKIRKTRRVFALILLLSLVCNVFAFAADTQEEATQEETSQETSDQEQDYQSQLDDLNNQLDDLKEKQEQIQDQIDQVQADKDQAQKEKDAIDAQIYTTAQQISLTEEKIALMEENINAVKQDIESTQQNIDEKFELYKRRVRQTYINGETNVLKAIFTANSFGDMVLHAQAAQKIAEKDQELINGLLDDKKELEDQQLILENEMTILDNTKTELETLKGNLNAQSSVAQQEIWDISEMEEAFLADKENLTKQMQQMQAEIDEIYANMQSSGEYTGDGTWGWPIANYRYISSYFGSRFGGSDYHTGIDITGTDVYGKPVLASADGTVAAVRYAANGYGKYLIIDHGGGYSTLYAHTSQILVSEGQQVKRGDTIALVGNTGWVIPGPTADNPYKGAHVHFEIRINGTAQNPLNYLS